MAVHGLQHNGYIKEQIDKIGNSLVYMSGKIPDLNKTKILKILFLLEEASLKKYGIPFFNIDFQIWVRGPVAKDIFIDLSDESPSMLKDYIVKDETTNNFRGVNEFNDDEFSENDIKLMDLIIDFAKNKQAGALVKHLHGSDSLWRKSAIKYGVLESLEKEEVSSTNYEIDFSLLFDNDPFLLERYESAKENFLFRKQLKS